MSLMYSTAKDKPVSRANLAQIPTPAPRGPRHRPYPFAAYVNDVHEALDKVGIAVHEEEYAVSKDHERMFGLMKIGTTDTAQLPETFQHSGITSAIEGELITSKEWNLLLGLRGSHDMRISREMVLGSRVVVCSNLQFFGNVANFSTKQTTNIASRLPGLIRQAVMRIPEMAERQERVFERYQDFALKPRGGDAALVEIYRRNGLSAAQLGRAVNEWHDPAFDEHAVNGWNAWRLLQSVTQAVKPTGQNVNHDLIAERTQIASSFIDEIAHIDF